MDGYSRVLCAALTAFAVSVAGFAAEDEEGDGAEAPITFERYRSIAERYPFGAPPPGFDPTDMSSAATAAAAARADARTEKELSAEENKLKSLVRLCAFNLTPDHRVMVGFVDNSQKPAASFYMAPGDKRGGWTVVSADVDAKTAVLEHDGVEVEVEFPRPGAAPAAANARGGMPGAGRSGMVAGGFARSGGASSAGGSALDRLRDRRAQLTKNAQEEEERRKQAAEQEKAEKAQREAEREQQKEQLLQIQEELRRQREAREAREREAEEKAPEDGAPPPAPQEE